MKTSIVAVLAASLFLVAALAGMGSGRGAPPPAPETIVLAGPYTGAVVSPAGGALSALPTPSAGEPSGLTQVVAVGRSVQQKNLKDILAAPGSEESRSSTGLVEAGGTPPTKGQVLPRDVIVRTTTGPAASPTPSRGAPRTVSSPSPTPTESPFTIIVPVPNPPRPVRSPPPQVPTPTPQPVPLPTASPSVTSTATPPVTSTATPVPGH